MSAKLTAVSRPGRRKRAVRLLDRQHFASVSGAAKTVKIADLIDTCRDLYKRDRMSLGTYAAEAREMMPMLEGGDTRLLERLKRDLDKYAPEIEIIEPVDSSEAFALVLGQVRRELRDQLGRDLGRQKVGAVALAELYQ